MIKENEKLDSLGIDNLNVIQNKDYFCFGIDSVLLANFVVSSSSNNIVVDLCSGSGVIPIIMSAKKKFKKIVAVELQNEMFDILERNVKLNFLEEKIFPLKEDVNKIDKIQKFIYNISNSDKADVVVCNPPYKIIGSGCKNENKVKFIARHEVMCGLEDIFRTSSKLLKSKGKLYIVHKPERIVDLMIFSRKYKLEAKRIRFVHPTYNKKPSIVLIEYVKDGKNECKILEPLIEYEKLNEKYTQEIKDIYNIK